MNCRKFRKLTAAYIDGELHQRELTAFETHRASCPACRAELETQESRVQALEQSLFNLADAAPATSIADGVLLRLASEQGTRNSRLSWLATPRLRSAAALAAAMLVLSAALALLFHGLVLPPNGGSPDILSGRQYAFTTRPGRDGRVYNGVTTRRFAQVRDPEAGRGR